MMDLSKYIVLNIRNHATWTDISCEYNINKIRHFTEDEVKGYLSNVSRWI